MSEEPTSTNGEWAMPDPIFRSTEGHTPKSAKNHVFQDDIETAAPDFDAADTDEFDTLPISADEIDTESPEKQEESVLPDRVDTEPKPVDIESKSVDTAKPPNAVRAAPKKPEKPTKSAGGCAKSAGTMFSIVAFVVIAILAAAVYFLFYYKPADTGTF